MQQDEQQRTIANGWERMRARMALEKRIRELKDEIRQLERERDELA